MSTTSTVSSEVGTRLLFENDRVRVWDLCLAPGESTGLHRHTDDYFFVVVGDGILQAGDDKGNKKQARAMRDGEVRFSEVPGENIHEATNVGDTPWRNIVVELKDPPAST
jgi:quercetin dioxygenase-like cupin family protein